MRVFFGLLLLIFVAVAGLWLGGETWLANTARDRLAADPRIQAEEITPLRQIDRIGLHLGQTRYGVSDVALNLPFLDLWIAPLSPITATASLPPKAQLRIGDRDHALQLPDASATIGVSALKGGAIDKAGLTSGPILANGSLLAEALSVSASLTGLGYDAPAAARSAYDVDLLLQDMQSAGLIDLGIELPDMPATWSASGRTRLWLDRIVDPQVMMPTGANAPKPVGVQSDGVVLQLDDQTVRVAGIVRRDADGLSEGQVAIYTSDAAALLEQAAAAGIVPQEVVMLGTVLLNGIGRMPFPATTGANGSDLPEPIAGELRLPVVMQGGRLFLGDIDVGPAPPFPGFQ